ncbi:mucin-2-like [Bolinopsis microptera]|uniref:mucin-2-like n=1 Tax=Bolinopsis microptera TaxID=2820187 RepID=UPI0030790F89
MPKVTTYRCSRCSYKSKDKTKVGKHIKLHNVLSAQKNDFDESSQSQDLNGGISVGSPQKLKKEKSVPKISKKQKPDSRSSKKRKPVSKNDPNEVSPASEDEAQVGLESLFSDGQKVYLATLESQLELVDAQKTCLAEWYSENSELSDSQKKFRTEWEIRESEVSDAKRECMEKWENGELTLSDPQKKCLAKWKYQSVLSEAEKKYKAKLDSKDADPSEARKKNDSKVKSQSGLSDAQKKRLETLEYQSEILGAYDRYLTTLESFLEPTAEYLHQHDPSISPSKLSKYDPSISPSKLSKYDPSISPSKLSKYDPSISPGKLSKYDPSISPGKLSRSNLSRTRPLDTSVFSLSKVPVNKTKLNDTQFKAETTPSVSNVLQTEAQSVSETSEIGHMGETGCLSGALPLTQFEGERESLEEIRHRFYMDRMKVNEDTVQVKEEVMDCKHPQQSAPLVPVFPLDPAPSLEHANWRRSVLGTAYSNLGTAYSNPSKNGQTKTKSKRRAKILIDTRCSWKENEQAEIIPELVSEEQAKIIPEVVHKGCSPPENPEKRSKIEEGPASKSQILDKVGYLKKLDTGNVSCKINQDTARSFKKGLLESASVMSDPSGSIPDKKATVLNNETKKLRSKTSTSEPTDSPFSSPMVNPPPFTSQPSTIPGTSVEVCSTRLIPLTQPPLVTPLVPVTAILHTNMINFVNIPVTVFSVPSAPLLVPVTVQSRTTSYPNLTVMSLDRSRDTAPQAALPSTNQFKSDGDSTKSVQTSKVKIDSEASSSAVSTELIETEQSTSSIVGELSMEKTENQPTPSNSSQSKPEPMKHSGLIMRPNCDNVMALSSSTDSSDTEGASNLVQSEDSTPNLVQSKDSTSNLVQSETCSVSSRSRVVWANKPSQPTVKISKPSNSSQMSHNSSQMSHNSSQMSHYSSQMSHKSCHSSQRDASRPGDNCMTTKPSPSQPSGGVLVDDPSQSSEQTVHNFSPHDFPPHSPEDLGNSSELDRVSTREEINDLKSMLRNVIKMMNDTSSLVQKITHKVTKLETKLQR